MTQFKKGDKIINTGGSWNLGVKATVVDTGRFADAPDCDLLVHSPHAIVRPGTDGLYKEHKFYTHSRNWSLVP